MRTLLVAAVLASAGWPAARPAAAAPRRHACDYAYYPTTPNAEWDYDNRLRTTLAGREPEETPTVHRVRVVERSGRVATMAVSVAGAAFTNEATYSVDCGAKGPSLRRSGQGAQAVRWRGVVIPARLRPGAAWTSEMIVDGPPANRHRTSARAARIETVAVPAGRFQALRVDFETRPVGTTPSTPAYVISGSYWYARGVGVVRYRSVTRSGAGEGAVTMETVNELAAFRPAGAEPPPAADTNRR